MVWDHVMVNLGCCGGNSYLDFTNSTTWASTRGGMQVRCQMSGDAMPGTLGQIICLDCASFLLYHK